MIKRKILLLGGTGFLGSEIAKLAPKNIELVKTKFDLLNFCLLQEKLNNIKPQIIIHVARVNPFDHNPDKVREATQKLVEAVKLINAKLVYVSSDAIFDGKKGNYKEDDRPNPKTNYGKAKLVAEEIITNSLDSFIIVRPSYIYGQTNGHWDKRIQELIDQIKSQQTVYRFKDMYRSPILVTNLANAIWQLINKDFSGVIHIAGTRKSVFQFSYELVKSLGLDFKLIKSDFLKDSKLDIAPDTSLSIDLAKKIINFRSK